MRGWWSEGGRSSGFQGFGVLDTGRNWVTSFCKKNSTLLASTMHLKPLHENMPK